MRTRFGNTADQKTFVIIVYLSISIIPVKNAGIARSYDPEKVYKEMSDIRAISRMGTPEEIVAAVLYLANDEGAFLKRSFTKKKQFLWHAR